jgi:prepilin-type N-terminal cleavage/methylation domain-containing protein
MSAAFRRISSPRQCGDVACERGFTLFEFAVVIGIFSILVIYLISKAFDNFELGEKAAMETQRAMMRAGMDLHIAGLITSGRERDTAKMSGQNPVDWLREKPPNYLGEFAGELPNAQDAWGWYFDTQKKELVYLPKRHAHLKPDRNGRFRIRFHVALPEEVNGTKRNSVWPVLGLVEPYSWF